MKLQEKKARKGLRNTDKIFKIAILKMITNPTVVSFINHFIKQILKI